VRFRDWQNDDGPSQFSWIERTEKWPMPFSLLAALIGYPLTFVGTIAICCGLQ
jgi:hypothetical protein